jgi:hypothetical protein
MDFIPYGNKAESRALIGCLVDPPLIIIDFSHCKLHFIFIISLHVGLFRLPNTPKPQNPYSSIEYD